MLSYTAPCSENSCIELWPGKIIDIFLKTWAAFRAAMRYLNFL
jgi:hypothetical protein